MKLKISLITVISILVLGVSGCEEDISNLNNIQKKSINIYYD